MNHSSPRSDLRRLAIVTIALLGASIGAFPPAFHEFFLREPGLVLAGVIAAFLVYLPSLWVTRRLDQRPFGLPVYAFSIMLVMAMSPVTSHLTTLLIRQGFYLWQVVGIVEEISKMLPALLFAVFAPHLVRNRRDGVVIGALAGLGFAIIEFAVAFALDNFPERGWADLTTSLPGRWALGTQAHIIWAATTGGAIGYLRERQPKAGRVVIVIGIILVVALTHDAQDFVGKFIAPMSIGLIGNALISLGVPETAFSEGRPMFMMLLVWGTVVNTIVINVAVLPILWWLVRSRVATDDTAEAPQAA